MAEMTGYAGKIARVDLSKGTVTTVETPVEVLKKFLGGSALGVYYLYKEGVVDPSVKPFDAANMLQFMIGPMNGFAPNARSVTVTKSAYNFISIATSGGRAAAELKFAGWDGIQIVGKSSKPVYLEVINDKITIKDAAHLWGKGAQETEKLLLDSIVAPLEFRESIVTDADMTPEWAAIRPPGGKGCGAKRLGAAWVIGQGGENRVWYANVITEGARAHGRYGPGAIMGDKKLKGIVIRGTQGQKFADKAKFLQLTKEIQASEAKDYFWRSYGTAGIGANTANIEDSYPIRNWQWDAWADPDAIKTLEGPFMDFTSFVHRMSCPNCHLHCMYTSQVTSADPLMDGAITDMPDWEAMGMVGGNLGFVELPGTSPNDTYKGTQADRAEGLAKTQFTTFRHDDYGMDYIEGGTLLALVAELRQRNLISAADLDGVDVKWGDVHSFDALLTKIVHREGIGDVLANGTWETAKYFAKKKGNDKILDYPVGQHRYGQPAHDVRGFDKNALEYVTVGRPSEHTGGGGAGFGKADYPAAIAGQNVKCSQDSLVYCIFAAGHWGGRTTGMVQAATGWSDFVEADLAKVGARQYAMNRLFDIHTQQLKDPKKDWDMVSYPKRWFEALPTGSAKGKRAYDGDVNKLFNEALPAYWKARGWSEDKGIPSTDKLKELGIDDIAESIAKTYR